MQPPPQEDGEGGKEGVQAVPPQPSAGKSWFWRWPGRHQDAEGKGTPVDKQEAAGQGLEGEVV